MSLLRLAAEKNPAEITTTHIAEAMGVTQGALFRHFPNKEAIRLAAVEWIEHTLSQMQETARQAVVTPLEALSAMFMAHVRFTIEHPGAPRLVFSELQQLAASPVRQRVHALMQNYRMYLSKIIDEARRSGLIAENTDPQAASALFLGAIQGLVIQLMLGAPPPVVEKQAHGMFELYLLGLRSGHEN